MKRILYFHHTGGLGGAPLSLLYLLQQLDRDRYEPMVVTLKDGPVVELYRAEGIETRVAPGISDFSHTTLEWYGGPDWWRLPGKLLKFGPSIRHARQVIRRIQPDIVHVNSSTLAACAIASQREGVPVVWHIREPLAQGYVGLRRKWLRRIIEQTAARVVAISAYDAEQLVPSERIHVIHNFVDFTHFDRTLDGQAVRQELGIAAGAALVLMLGGVSAPKGTLTLIRALPILVEALPGIQVVVAGQPPGPLKGEGVKGMVKRLLRADVYQRACQSVLEAFPVTIRQSMRYVGLRSDVPMLLAAADCLVFPSSVPHFARPVIEAAAMGKPAIASDVGGPRELIVEGETGRLVPPDDPAKLAEALLSVLETPSIVQQLGEAAYQRAREMFDAGRNAARTIGLYDDVFNDQG